MTNLISFTISNYWRLPGNILSKFKSVGRNFLTLWYRSLYLPTEIDASEYSQYKHRHMHISIFPTNIFPNTSPLLSFHLHFIIRLRMFILMREPVTLFPSAGIILKKKNNNNSKRFMYMNLIWLNKGMRFSHEWSAYHETQMMTC